MLALVVVNALLLAACAAAIAAVQVHHPADAAVEAAVRRYADAVTRQDLAGAEAEIAPQSRARWQGFIQNQLGNDYVVRTVSVRSAAPLDRLLHHASGQPYEVTVTLNIDPGDATSFYQPTTRVQLRLDGGRWYLAQPLLEPEAAASG